jgi:ribosomal protein S18 acetylase RimI-like enzyme
LKETDGIAIRPARPPEADAIEALVRAAYTHYVVRIGREPAPMTADYPALIEAGEVWVANDGNELVGVLVIRASGDALLLENVAVQPGDQRRGIGRALIAFAEQEARRRGLAKVSLYTHERMSENLAFYPRLGYVEIGRRAEHGFARVFFSKLLTE